MICRALFVDDEPNILEALQRMLRPLRNEWEMRFARGGAEAIAMITNQPADVVVTDMRMPGMDGDELLARVRQLHPQTVRIILTGQCGKSAVMRLIPLAHRILSKPFDGEGLRNVLRRTYSLHSLLTSPSLAAVVGHLGGLPTLPDHHSRVLTELEKPDVSLARVAELAAEDMGLTSKLMQFANSALFGLRQPVAALTKAVQVLGMEMTRGMLMAANIFDHYNPHKLHPYSINSLWAHSRQVGELAGQIARAESGAERPTEAALAGLLHDVGRLTLASQMPEAYKEALRLVHQDGRTLLEAEQQVFGATHAEVGAYLLGLWGLPDAVVEAVAWHHQPSVCPGGGFTPLTAVHVAEALLGEEEASALDREYLDRLKLADKVASWAAMTGEGREVR